MRHISELHRLDWTLLGLCASTFLVKFAGKQAAGMKAAVKYSDQPKWFWIGAFNCQMSNPVAGEDEAWIQWMTKCYRSRKKV